MKTNIEVKRQACKGFTLIEVIVVIIILGIISAIGSNFVISSADQYRTAEITNKLIQRGRLSIEQISRELHMALPNAIRISSSGNCMEFLPIVASASYQSRVPDQANAKAAANSIKTSSFVMGRGTPRYVVIAPFSSSEVYVNSVEAVIVPVGLLGPPPYDTIPLSATHRFLRNSIGQRVFIIDNPVRYCISGGNLVRYSDYGFLTSALGDSDPGGVSDLVSHQVASSTGMMSFVLSTGSEDMNQAVHMNLVFSKASISIDLNHQVVLRNVP